jgi:hypothetical protein
MVRQVRVDKWQGESKGWPNYWRSAVAVPERLLFQHLQVVVNYNLIHGAVVL